MSIKSFNLINLFVVIAFFIFIPASYADVYKKIKSDNWTFSFNNQTGTDISICWKESEITHKSKAIPVDIQLAPKTWLSSSNKYDFNNYKWDELNKTLSLVYNISDLELSDNYKFGDSGKAGRIRRSLTIKYLKGKEPIKFYKSRLVTEIPKKGKYFFPAYPYKKERKGLLQKLAVGFKFTSIWGCGPFMVEDANENSVLFINDARQDAARTEIEVKTDSVSVYSDFWSSGWLFPGKAQTITYAYIDIDSQNINKAFKSQIWDWYQDVGIKVPADRPDWIYDATMYYFRATKILGGYNSDTQQKGLVIAREKLLPKIKEMGFNTLWVQPLEDKLGYWPRNFYKFHPSAGNPQDFVDFVKAGHKLGLRVMQDIVPHGGTPYFGQLRGNSPLSLFFDEKGNARNYWCFDLLDPDWLKYMKKIAVHHTKEFGHDGFRIDACAGTLAPNWRRKGFPSYDKVPKNVDAEVWHAELDKFGKECPPLPYERGSFSLRKGGLEMIKAIRQGTRSVNKQAVVLAETQHSPYMQETDIIYDAELDVYQWQKFRTMPAENFVSGLQDLFEEQKFAEPRNTYRMRFVGCHDRYTLRGFYDDNVYKALNAIIWGIECMPMMFYKNETLISSYMKRLNKARKLLPELRRGDGFYTAVESSDKKIFTCLRTFKKATTLVCVNMQNKTVQAEMKFDKKFNQTNAANAIDILSGEKLKLYKQGNSLIIKPKLKAWQAAYIRLGGSSQLIVDINNSADKSSKINLGTEIKINVQKEELQVSSANYNININSGLITEMTTPQGKTILGASEIIFNRVLKDFKYNLLKIDQEKHQAIYEITPCKGTKINITYSFTPQKVLIEAKLSGFDKFDTKHAGFTFDFVNPERYYISTSSSFINESNNIVSIYQAGRSEREYKCYTRPYFCNEYIWQNIFRPLSPRNPVIGSLKGNRGLQIKFTNILSGNYDNIAMLDNLDQKTGCYLACMWIQNTVPGDINDNTRCFKLEIAPGRTPAPIKQQPYLFVQKDDLQILNNGIGWTIENKHFKLKLSKAGGLIKEFLSKRTNKNLLYNSSIYTNSGFRQQYSCTQKVSASADNDGQTGITIRQKGNGYLLSFSGILSTGRMGSILPQPIWYKTQYYVDDSSQVAINWAVMSEGAPFADKNADITGRLYFSNDLKIFLQDKAQEYSCPVWKQDQKKYFGVNAVLNYYTWKKHEPLAKCSNFHKSGEAPKSFYVRKQFMFIPWLEGMDDKFFKPKNWYAVSFMLSLNNKNSKLPEDTFAKLYKIEHRNDFKLPAKRYFMSSFNDYYGWTRPHSGTFSYQEQQVFGNKQICFMLDSKFFKENGIYKKLLDMTEYPVGSELTATAIIKGEDIKPGFNWPGGIFRIRFELANGKMVRKGLSHLDGSYDWQKFVFKTKVPADVRRAYLEIGLDGAKGKMYFCDISITKKE